MLVEPKHGGNVGAAARAMANFGFDDLVIAGETPSLEGEAEWWATTGSNVLSGAREVETLAEAIGDCHLSVATTSARGRGSEPPLSPRDVAARLELLPDGERLALVFGRERSGLTSEEIALCGLSATIPTSDEAPTMNLALSVAIFCYEARLGLGTASSKPERREERADLESLQRLHEAALRLLDDAGFLNPQNREGTYSEMRELAARAELSRREVTILLGIIRQLSWWGRR